MLLWNEMNKQVLLTLKDLFYTTFQFRIETVQSVIICVLYPGDDSGKQLEECCEAF